MFKIKVFAIGLLCCLFLLPIGCCSPNVLPKEEPISVEITTKLQAFSYLYSSTNLYLGLIYKKDCSFCEHLRSVATQYVKENKGQILLLTGDEDLWRAEIRRFALGPAPKLYLVRDFTILMTFDEDVTIETLRSLISAIDE